MSMVSLPRPKAPVKEPEAPKPKKKPGRPKKLDQGASQ